MFRQFLEESFAAHPELFPDAFKAGFRFKDCRTSEKLGIAIRRIECKADGSAFSIIPSFVMPYMVGFTDEVANGLFLRTFGVPYWALAKVFGRDPDGSGGICYNSTDLPVPGKGIKRPLFLRLGAVGRRRCF